MALSRHMQFLKTDLFIGSSQIFFKTVYFNKTSLMVPVSIH